MYKIVYFLFKSVAILPLWFLYGISNILYLILYYVVRYRRRITRINLQHAFPDKPDSWHKKTEKKFYRHLCDNIVETIKLLHISDKEADRRIVVTNGDMIDELAKDGRSFMLLLGHYGNWEWVPAITRHYKMLDYNGQIYRPLKNKIFNQLLLKIRSRFNTVCIPQKKAMRNLLQAHINHQQMLIGFVADQRPNTENVHHYFPFLNQNTNFSVGAEFVGKKINARYLFMEVKIIRRGYIELTFHEIKPETNTQEEYPVTRRYTEMLEKEICKAPEYWLWSHNRWSLPYKKNKK